MAIQLNGGSILGHGGPLPENFNVEESRKELEAHKREMIDTILRLAEEKTGWSNAGTTKGVLVEKKDCDPFPMSRGVVNFGSSFGPFDFLELLRYHGTEWDPLMLESKALCEFDYYLAVVYMAFKGMMMYDGRDFKNVAWLEVVSPTCVVQACKGWEAWPDPAPVPKRKVVRGNMLICGHVMKVLADGSLEITSVIQPDMRVANVPKSVLLRAPFMTDPHVNMAKMKEMLYTKGITPSPHRPVKVLKELCLCPPVEHQEAVDPKVEGLTLKLAQTLPLSHGKEEMMTPLDAAKKAVNATYDTLSPAVKDGASLCQGGGLGKAEGSPRCN